MLVRHRIAAAHNGVVQLFTSWIACVRPVQLVCTCADNYMIASLFSILCTCFTANPQNKADPLRVARCSLMTLMISNLNRVRCSETSVSTQFQHVYPCSETRHCKHIHTVHGGATQHNKSTSTPFWVRSYRRGK